MRNRERIARLFGTAALVGLVIGESKEASASDVSKELNRARQDAIVVDAGNISEIADTGPIKLSVDDQPGEDGPEGEIVIGTATISETIYLYDEGGNPTGELPPGDYDVVATPLNGQQLVLLISGRLITIDASSEVTFEPVEGSDLQPGIADALAPTDEGTQAEAVETAEAPRSSEYRTRIAEFIGDHGVSVSIYTDRPYLIDQQPNFEINPNSSFNIAKYFETRYGLENADIEIIQRFGIVGSSAVSGAENALPPGYAHTAVGETAYMFKEELSSGEVSPDNLVSLTVYAIIDVQNFLGKPYQDRAISEMSIVSEIEAVHLALGIIANGDLPSENNPADPFWRDPNSPIRIVVNEEPFVWHANTNGPLPQDLAETSIDFAMHADDLSVDATPVPIKVSGWNTVEVN
jgi:hypothetical protein